MNNKKAIIIESNKIILRSLEYGDLRMVFDWRNHENNRKWFFNSDELTFNQHLSWFQKYEDLPNDYLFIAEYKSENKNVPFGQVAIYNIDFAESTGEFGRFLIGNDEFKGKGLGTEMIQTVLKIAKESLGLKQIYLEVKINNEVAIHLYKKNGFEPISVTQSSISMELDL